MLNLYIPPDPITCIYIQSCLTVFRALSSLEKTVDYFTLTLNLKLSKLVFIFHCRHGEQCNTPHSLWSSVWWYVQCVYVSCAGIVKTHNLGFQECEALQAVFSKNLCPNHIKVQSRLAYIIIL